MLVDTSPRTPGSSVAPPCAIASGDALLFCMNSAAFASRSATFSPASCHLFNCSRNTRFSAISAASAARAESNLDAKVLASGVAPAALRKCGAVAAGLSRGDEGTSKASARSRPSGGGGGSLALVKLSGDEPRSLSSGSSTGKDANGGAMTGGRRPAAEAPDKPNRSDASSHVGSCGGCSCCGASCWMCCPGNCSKRLAS
mmetsp:Transcript_75823/g.212564  ORF Transcript_75823/g.212564 Transcript_75823/m.212564 type:complete len:200 (-) Transcript_75823:245-844(-)